MLIIYIFSFFYRCENEMPAAKRARTLSWKAETDADRAPQTLRFRPAREPGPQLTTADAHSPMSLFKLFFTESTVENLCHNTNAQAARAAAKGRKYKWTDVNVDELYRYIGLVFYMATTSTWGVLTCPISCCNTTLHSTKP